MAPAGQGCFRLREPIGESGRHLSPRDNKHDALFRPRAAALASSLVREKESQARPPGLPPGNRLRKDAPDSRPSRCVEAPKPVEWSFRRALAGFLDYEHRRRIAVHVSQGHDSQRALPHRERWSVVT
jgi:hypothetical protein